MKIRNFFNETDLSNSLVVGFYGGGNFGDELLMEILMNVFREYNYKNVCFYYSNPDFYNIFHHDFHYKMINGKKKITLFKSFFKIKNIVVGGGGLWGLDFNKNVFFLSLILFFSRLILMKKIYLIGVGYYNSTTFLGKIGAFFAGLASNIIIVRDTESKENFSFFKSKTFLAEDIGFLLSELDLSSYKKETRAFSKILNSDKKHVFISIRRFQKKYSNDYLKTVIDVVRRNLKINFILTTFEPREVDPVSYQTLLKLSHQQENLQFLEFRYNPIVLYLFFKQNNKNLLAILPQFHGIIIAYLAGIKFLPFSYDNKVSALFEYFNIQRYKSINSINMGDIEIFLSEVS